MAILYVMMIGVGGFLGIRALLAMREQGRSGYLAACKYGTSGGFLLVLCGAIKYHDWLTYGRALIVGGAILWALSLLHGLCASSLGFRLDHNRWPKPGEMTQK